MAEGASNELLEWPKKDKRRILHAVYRVGDLDRTIKYVVFSTLGKLVFSSATFFVPHCCLFLFPC